MANLPPSPDYSTGWLSLYEGAAGIGYVACPNGVMMVPVMPDGQVILIHEPPAYGDGERTLLRSDGVIDPGEQAGGAANPAFQEGHGFPDGRRGAAPPGRGGAFHQCGGGAGAVGSRERPHKRRVLACQAAGAGCLQPTETGAISRSLLQPRFAIQAARREDASRAAAEGEQ